MGQRLIIEIFVTAVIGLVLGLFGPFGTYELPIVIRLLYWSIFGLVGYAIFRPIIIVGNWFSESLRISPLIGRAIALSVAACPMTLLVAWLLSGFDWRIVLRATSLGELYLQVWLIGLMVNTLTAVLFRRSVFEPSTIASAPAPIPMSIADQTTPDANKTSSALLVSAEREAVMLADRFANRLPPGFGTLLALKAEDHYVRAIGEHRETLILIRLRDALAELGDGIGVRVHRSWWVANDAVARVERSGRAAELILINDLRVPVSRESIGAIRSTGWPGV